MSIYYKNVTPLDSKGDDAHLGPLGNVTTTTPRDFYVLFLPNTFLLW